MVGEIADSLLLGLDFLEHCISIIDLQNYTITFDGNVLPIRQFGSGPDEKVDVFQVYVHKKTVIPPCSIRYVLLKTDRPFQGDILVETEKNSIGLLAPNALIDKTQRMIPYRNTTEKFVTLTKGQKIGTGIGISDVIDLEDNEAVKVNQIKQSSRESKNKDERNKTEIPSQATVTKSI